MENIKSSEISELDILFSKYSPYFVEIKRRLILTLCFFVVATLVGFIFYEDIIRFMIDILSLKGINIVFTSPFQFINLSISCGLATGLVLVFPLIIYQILSFLKPALKKIEFTMLVGFLPFSIILFLMGFAFGVLIMKWQIQIFLAKSVSLGIGNILDISHLLSVVLMTSALMGIGFQFPLVILFLLRLGIIKKHHLIKVRPWVYLGFFIFAILLPPDSVLADVLLTLPFIILYEITLILNRFFEKGKVALV